MGIIGCGNVTEIKSGCLNKIKNSELIAVMRRDIDLAKDYCIRHHAKRYYNTIDDILNDVEINSIYIATPPVYHREYAISALKYVIYMCVLIYLFRCIDNSYILV